MSDQRVQQLIDWASQRQAAAGLEVGPDTDLLATGIVDSMGLVSLLFLVETMGGRPADPAEMAEAGPVTPAAIVARCF